MQLSVQPDLKAALVREGLSRLAKRPSIDIPDETWAKYSPIIAAQYGHIDAREQEILTAIFCLTHPDHPHPKYRAPSVATATTLEQQLERARRELRVFFTILVLLLLIVLASKRAHAQSQISVIQFQDSSATTVATYAAPFKIRCSTNITCTPGAGGLMTITASGTGTGGGVSSFASGNLSPLFTTSVATSTSTPVQSFTLSNAAAHTFFGNNTGSAAAPSYFVPVAADLPNLPESQITSLVSDLAGKAASNASITVNGVTCTISGSCTVADATKVPTSTTVNGHALSGNVTVTASDVGLGSVTNDAQTKAAIVPNTVPAAGQVPIGNAGGTAYAPQAFSGDCTLASTGGITCLKTNGSAFAASATTDATNATNITTGTLPAGRLPAMTGDATSTAGSNASTVVAVNGTTVPTNAAADQTIVTTAAATGAWKSIGSCSGASNALTYNTTTHAYGCNTITGSGGSTPSGTGFTHITGGTQDAAAVAVGLGSADTSGNITPAKAVDPASYFDLKDDFLNGATTTGNIGESGWVFSGTAPSAITATANHPGVIKMVTTTTSANVTYISAASTSANQIPPVNTTNPFKLTWIIQYDSSSTNNLTQSVVRIGLAQGTASNTAPTNGIYFENTSTTTAANWTANLRVASVTTNPSVASPVALNNSWHRFDIAWDGTTLTFSVDGSTYGTLSSPTLPSVAMYPIAMIGTSESAAKALDIDYFRLWMAVTR